MTRFLQLISLPLLLVGSCYADECSFPGTQSVSFPDFVKKNVLKHPPPNAIWAGKGPVLVNVVILVDKEGHVKDTCVPRQSWVSIGLISASREASRNWIFKPTEKRKQKYQVEWVRAMITYRFVPPENR